MSKVLAFLFENKPLRLAEEPGGPAPESVAPQPFVPHTLEGEAAAHAAAPSAAPAAAPPVAPPALEGAGDDDDTLDAAALEDSDAEYDLYAPKRARLEPACSERPPPPPLTREDLERPLSESDEDDFEEAAEEENQEDEAADERARIGYPVLGLRATPVAPLEDLVLQAEAAGGKAGRVPAHINQYLREYQKEGVRFLWRAYTGKRGGVLADEMGLGKTVQAIAFLMALFEKEATAAEAHASEPTLHAAMAAATARMAVVAGSGGSGGAGVPATEAGAAGAAAAGSPPKLALVVCPASVLDNWQRELRTWCPFRVRIAHAAGKADALEAARGRRCEVLIVSYHLLHSEIATLLAIDPTVAIFDEAHCLKNEKSNAAKAARQLRTRTRLALTGTPMANDMSELWSLLDLVSCGRVGAKAHFASAFCEPIKHGMKVHAKDREIAAREVAREGLKKVLDRWMLQRRKQVIAAQLPRKVDNIVVCPLEPSQRDVYSRVLRSSDCASLRNACLPCGCGSGVLLKECCKLEGEGGPLWRQHHPDGHECPKCPFCISLPAITQLLKIANHLDLVRACRRDPPDIYARDAAFAKMAWGCEDDAAGGRAHGGVDERRPWELSERLEARASSAGCGKLAALRLLLAEWRREPESKVLLFSHSVRMLDLLEAAIAIDGHPYLRLDGSTPVRQRAKLVDRFNAPGSSKFVFLISTRAGGLGLNLVAANKVVVFDPNWNPSHDLQAQDRAFRIGQRRDVDVYRLVAAATVEERIYLRQVYKQKIAAIALEAANEARVFAAVQGDEANKGELFGLANLLALEQQHSVLTSQIIRRGEAGHERVKSLGSGVEIARVRSADADADGVAEGGDALGGASAAAAGAGAQAGGAAGGGGGGAAAGGDAACEGDEHGVGALVQQLQREEDTKATAQRRALALHAPLAAHRPAVQPASPARGTPDQRAELARAGAAVHHHDHRAAVGSGCAAEDELVAKVMALRAAAAAAAHQPQPAGAVAGGAALARRGGWVERANAATPTGAQGAAGHAGGQPAGRAAPLASSALETAKRLLEHALRGSFELGKDAFMAALTGEVALARAVHDMTDAERNAFASVLNKRRA